MKNGGLLSVLRLVAITVIAGLSASYGVYGYQLTPYEKNYSQGGYGFAEYPSMAVYSKWYGNYRNYKYSVAYDKDRYSQYDLRGQYAYTSAYSNRWEYDKSYNSYKSPTASRWTKYPGKVYRPDAYGMAGTHYRFGYI